MWNIYKHLDKIKVRPWMYLWDNKISTLNNYIYWFYWCIKEFNIDNHEIKDFQLFHDWVANYYWYKESTSWWKNMILKNSKNEEDALSNFFILIEEFKSAK